MGTLSSKLEVSADAPNAPASVAPVASSAPAALPRSAGKFTASVAPQKPFTPSPRTVQAHYEAAVVKLQAYIRRWHVETLFEKALRRRSVAEELLQTEINYIANLRLLVTKFVEPLQQSSTSDALSLHSSADKVSEPILSAIEVRTLFSSVQVLLPIQEMFLADLQAKIDKWHYDQTLGAMLSTMTPFLRLYAEYIGNFSEATELYQKLTSKRSEGNRKFKEFLEKAYNDPKVMAIGDLDSFLVQPIQRLPRYKMFLEQLLKLTPEGHADRTALQLALAKVSETVSYVNEKKRTHDQELQVVTVFGKIEPPQDDLVRPGRALLQEGALQWSKSLKESRVKSWYFLFSDLLVITKQPTDAGKKYKFVARFDLRTLSLDAIASHPSKGEHTPQNSLGEKHTSKKSNDTIHKPSPSEIKLAVPVRDPCFYIETKYNGQTCVLCWKEEAEAFKFLADANEAAEKVLLARETNPTTSEGKAHAFKASIRNHHTTASGTLILKQGRDSRSPEHRPTRSDPAPSVTPPKARPTADAPSPIPQSPSAINPDIKTADSPASSPEPQQKALRRFAERKRELGFKKPS